MFDRLTGRLNDIFGRLRKRGSLTEADVDATLREVRIALLEADVALPVVKDFITDIRPHAIGHQVISSVTPAQQMIKLVHDHLVKILGAEPVGLELRGSLSIILMVGLQGSGKTTTAGKLALRLKNTQNKKVMLASLDTSRPAAQLQLEILAKQSGASSLAIIEGQEPLAITRRALEMAAREGVDVLVLDTAGRLAIDEALMAEVKAIKELAKPQEVLLVADSMTGQDATNVARSFDEAVGVTGIVLTRSDGDAPGGAALSMRFLTGKPVKFLGTSEKLDGLEVFDANRIAGRILGMGDVVSLVEKAMAAVDEDEASKMAAKFEKGGDFDLEDYLAQIRQMKRMGGLGAIMKMLPGFEGMKDKVAGKIPDDSVLKKQEAIILSMTRKERRRPEILNASRRRRIASGSGVQVMDVNQLIKQHVQMQDMMKKVRKLGKKGLMRQGMGALFSNQKGDQKFRK
ncbi:MAG: signal recognition particle protein [Alphaproteobacteria bacterium]